MNKLLNIESILLLAVLLFTSCSSNDDEEKGKFTLENPAIGEFLRIDDSGNFITSFIIIEANGEEYRFEQEYLEGMEDPEAITGKKIKVWYDEANDSRYRMIIEDGKEPTEDIDPSWRKIEGTYETWATEDDLYAGDMPQDFTILATGTEMTFESYLSEEDLQLKGKKVVVYYEPIINRYANKVEVLK